MGLGLGLGIWWPTQTSIIPGLLKALCARATYCENKLCTTATLEEIAAVRYTAPVLPTGLLADYPGASAAYSLRNLIDTTTNVVRVRRSSDNLERDFTAAEITDGTLTTFTGANDGFVTTWYDQSGSGLDVSNPTAITQPSIVVSGVLNTLGGKPTINVNGNKFLVAPDVSKSTLAFAHQNEATITCVTNFTQNGIWAGTSSAAYGNSSSQGFEIGYRTWGGVLSVRPNVVYQGSSVTSGYNLYYFELLLHYQIQRYFANHLIL